MNKLAGILLFGLALCPGSAQGLDLQWVQAGNPGGGWITALAESNSCLFAATREGGIFLSPDKGASWKTVNAGLPAEIDVQCLAVTGADIFAGTVGQGVFLSEDNGLNWMAVNAGLPEGCSVWRIVVRGSDLFAAAAFERAKLLKPELFKKEK